MGEVFSDGKMAANMLDIGNKTNNMDWVYIWQVRMRKKQVIGKKDYESNGMKEKKLNYWNNKEYWMN